MAQTADKVVEYANNKQWHSIIQCCASADISSEQRPRLLYYEALALYELGNRFDALKTLEALSNTKYDNKDALELKVKTLLSLGFVNEAASVYAKLTNLDVLSNELKINLSEFARKEQFWWQAIKINENLASVKMPIENSKYCIVVQCCNNPAEIDAFFESLCSCCHTGHFDLNIIQDRGDNEPGGEVDAWISTWNRIELWLPKLRQAFLSVEITRNKSNLGQDKTRVVGISEVVDHYDGFIYLESSCILSKGALLWMRYGILNYIDSYEIMFVTGLSVIESFPDAHLIDLKHRRAAQSEYHFASKYARVAWIPSQCFATTSYVWTQLNCSRYAMSGQGVLEDVIKQMNKYSIVPIFQFVIDSSASKVAEMIIDHDADGGSAEDELVERIQRGMIFPNQEYANGLKGLLSDLSKQPTQN